MSHEEEDDDWENVDHDAERSTDLDTGGDVLDGGGDVGEFYQHHELENDNNEEAAFDDPNLHLHDVDLDLGEEDDEEGDAHADINGVVSKGGKGGAAADDKPNKKPGKPAVRRTKDTVTRDVSMRHASILAELAYLRQLSNSCNDEAVQSSMERLVARDMESDDAEIEHTITGEVVPSIQLVKRLVERSGFYLKTVEKPSALQCRPAAVTRYASLLAINPEQPPPFPHQLPAKTTSKKSSTASSAASSSSSSSRSSGPSAATIAHERAAFGEARYLHTQFDAVFLGSNRLQQQQQRAPPTSEISPAALISVLAEKRLEKKCTPLQHVLLVGALLRRLGFSVRVVHALTVLDFGVLSELCDAAEVARRMRVAKKHSAAAVTSAVDVAGGSDAKRRRLSQEQTSASGSSSSKRLSMSTAAATATADDDNECIVIDGDDEEVPSSASKLKLAAPTPSRRASKTVLLLDDDDDDNDDVAEGIRSQITYSESSVGRRTGTVFDASPSVDTAASTASSTEKRKRASSPSFEHSELPSSSTPASSSSGKAAAAAAVALPASSSSGKAASAALLSSDVYVHRVGVERIDAAMLKKAASISSWLEVWASAPPASAPTPAPPSSSKKKPTAASVASAVEASSNDSGSKKSAKKKAAKKTLSVKKGRVVECETDASEAEVIIDGEDEDNIVVGHSSSSTTGAASAATSSLSLSRDATSTSDRIPRSTSTFDRVPVKPRWVSVDPVQGWCDEPTRIDKARPRSDPLLYAIGCGNDGTMKDVSKRYTLDWSRIVQTRIAHGVDVPASAVKNDAFGAIRDSKALQLQLEATAGGARVPPKGAKGAGKKASWGGRFPGLAHVLGRPHRSSDPVPQGSESWLEHTLRVVSGARPSMFAGSAAAGGRGKLDSSSSTHVPASSAATVNHSSSSGSSNSPAPSSGAAAVNRSSSGSTAPSSASSTPSRVLLAAAAEARLNASNSQQQQPSPSSSSIGSVVTASAASSAALPSSPPSKLKLGSAMSSSPPHQASQHPSLVPASAGNNFNVDAAIELGENDDDVDSVVVPQPARSQKVATAATSAPSRSGSEAAAAAPSAHPEECIEVDDDDDLTEVIITSLHDSNNSFKKGNNNNNSSSSSSMNNHYSNSTSSSSVGGGGGNSSHYNHSGSSSSLPFKGNMIASSSSSGPSSSSNFNLSSLDDEWDSDLGPASSSASAAGPHHYDEDAELAAAASSQSPSLPTSLAAFKSHAHFVLEEHLGPYEALDAGEAARKKHGHAAKPPPVSYFKSKPVYARRCVVRCLTEEAWRRLPGATARSVRPEEVNRPVRTMAKRAPKAGAAADRGGWRGGRGRGGGTASSSSSSSSSTAGKKRRSGDDHHDDDDDDHNAHYGFGGSSSSSSAGADDEISYPGGLGAAAAAATESAALELGGSTIGSGPAASLKRLYAEWQTVPYAPKPYTGGPLPTTGGFANFELWGGNTVLLPAGLTWVKLPQAKQAAKKLNIPVVDCFTGFDSHKGRQVPVLQGIIVSSQFAESLAAGSEVQQQITIESAAKKKQYRVLDNWKRIVNGKLLRTRMDAEYGRS